MKRNLSGPEFRAENTPGRGQPLESTDGKQRDGKQRGAARTASS